MDNLQWVNTWARYRATDANGMTWEYEEEPEIYETDQNWMPKWDLPFTNFDSISDGPPCPNWRESLEQRPAGEG